MIFLSPLLYAMGLGVLGFLGRLDISFVLVLGSILIFMGGAQSFTEEWQEGLIEQWVAEMAPLEGIVFQRLSQHIVCQVLPMLILAGGIVQPEMSALCALSCAFVTWMALSLMLSVLLLGRQQALLLAPFVAFPLAVPQLLLTLGMAFGSHRIGLQLGLTCVTLGLSMLVTPALIRWSVR